MAVKVRLSRFGKKNAPMYRIIATDSKWKRDGKYLENLGTYNPLKNQIVQFKEERISFWVSKGAILSDAVKKLHRVYQKKQIDNPIQMEPSKGI